MHLYVRSLGWATTTVECQPYWTLRQLKHAYCKKQKVSFRSFYLALSGKPLHDLTVTLESLEFTDGSCMLAIPVLDSGVTSVE